MTLWMRLTPIFSAITFHHRESARPGLSGMPWRIGEQLSAMLQGARSMDGWYLATRGAKHPLK